MSNDAIKSITAKLAEIFAEMDVKVAADARAWGIAKRDAIKTVQDELKGKRRELGEWAYYARMFAAAGGKTWYSALAGLNDNGVIATMDKNSAAVAAKRNLTIANKLINANVTSVIESAFTRTHDGFNGTFIVETDKGRKTVTINSIYAGGYNIQCFHIRVLVKIK